MRLLSALLLTILGGVASAQALDGPVTVVFGSDRAIPAPVMSALRSEAEAAVLPSLIRLSWRSSDASEPSSVGFRVAVVRFHGNCRNGAPWRVALKTTQVEALGQTATADGAVLPFADIECDATRQFLDREIRALPADEQDEALGRALGRVVAHELYHILLRTRSHGRNGLGRPMISRADLMTPQHRFAFADQQRLTEAVSEELASDSVSR